mmetsp:Transcript_4058/g.6772  ORF Transcript_4058/g.6772 Transcript_4058/m.6772 type:complete len:335 (+) Transcript_4058:35-1039(+)|eukprot:CAMPEP_0119315570 /NCGR_PEP_ID=MMETSP1333-20130426/36371_1 /TAXON_ID=418940 /ORGANISM="Scyphosphaera apsteinii, Strain RCC1455" /LENGTH=334 /DNA_ID=CAMNT_0007320983 /DNA_START=34 /DNA_END=1038 /DNA_ORIENTATION=+
MVFNSFRSMLRMGAGGVAAVTIAVPAQALWLRINYQGNEPLPEARGPLSGIVRWAQQARVSKPLGHFQPTQSGARLRGTYMSNQHAAPHDTQRAGRPANILFLGDSLVTGVGCSQERSCGPALPLAVAEFISKRLRVDVQWAAIGETGCDVRVLREKLVPAFAHEVRRVRTLGQHIDVVVIVCGLNDFKSAYHSLQNTAEDFRLQLSDVVAQVQQQTGVHCTVVLPALPVHRAPVFQNVQPLLSFTSHLAALWDEQKFLISKSLPRRVCFVKNAQEDDWYSASKYWAIDGIHPSDEGYRVWGEHIGTSIVDHLLHRRSTDQQFPKRDWLSAQAN